MSEWGPFEYGLLISLFPLLLASGFFSGSETALFGMSHPQRMKLTQSGSLAGRAVESLLNQPRMLLITILLGNMVVNVFYFVISSVLMLSLKANVAINLVAILTSLMMLVLLGEVLPKIIANTRQIMFAKLVATPLLTLHTIIAPIRIVLERFVVTPLSRLTAPSLVPESLDERELRELLDLSGASGAINPEERRMLGDVIKLGRLKVRDVMTPRVKVLALEEGSTRDELIEVLAKKRLTKLPIYQSDLDHVVGVLHVKQFLIARHERVTLDLPEVDTPLFVPEIATLDKLLAHFRVAPLQSAIVVDEYGGTAGIVSIEDVVEEIVGDIVGTDESRKIHIRTIGDGVWSILGQMNLQEWATRFDLNLENALTSTLSGFVVEQLGRPAEVGDVVEFQGVRLEVMSVDGSLITQLHQQSIVHKPSENQGSTDSSDNTESDA
ncbi:MAG: hemolysin family protein [Planctomycetota bacterium]|nr:hemolysin family protein [Planctomycetota bacterium]